MTNPFKKKPDHTIDYVVLTAILATTAILVRVLSLTRGAMALITLLVSIAYVVWGVTHHKKAGHIDQKIFLEYLGLALAVNILVLVLTF